MLNIISLTALRNKITWPGKVVKNLMKWLDKLGYPYVLNYDLNATKRLWIHDDTFSLKKLRHLSPETCCIIGPNLYALPRAVPESLALDKFPHLMPASWVVDFWKSFGYKWLLDSWPVGIDTEYFIPSDEEKTEVLVYCKQRTQSDYQTVIDLLCKKKVQHQILRYGNYTESEFQGVLRKSKYVIWIGCSESQGIALWEILATDTPVLIWDINYLGQCDFGANSFTEAELAYSWVTSAPYFDDTCGIRIHKSWELDGAISQMESSFWLFQSRRYVEENLSLDGQARKFIELYDSYFGLSYEAGFSESLHLEKRHRSNLFIQKAFDIYDSPFGNFIRKKLK